MTEFPIDAHGDHCPYPLQFDVRHCAPLVDFGARVQSFLRWIPLAPNSVLLDSTGNPLKPSWISSQGFIFRQVTKRWLGNEPHITSMRLYSVGGRANCSGLCIIARHGLAELEDGCQYLFRIVVIPDQHPTGFRRFLSAAIAEASQQRTATAQAVGSSAHADRSA
ncbi:hypothetical protein [Thalassobaculum sp.]|uniref:hypothetical protein n=1 Tax=Thalassobaculum sp. TaxID=2022740 RepID=UPI0032F09649